MYCVAVFKYTHLYYASKRHRGDLHLHDSSRIFDEELNWYVPSHMDEKSQVS